MQHLFSDFKPSTAADWKSQVTKDLKGEAYDSLVWKNENGFDIEPFYTSENLKHSYEPAFTHAGWDICVTGKSNNAKELNAQLLRDLQNGASSISVNCDGLDLEVALKEIQLNYIHAAFFVKAAHAADLKKYLEKHYDLSQLQCSVFPDKLETADDLNQWKQAVQLFRDCRNIKTICVDLLRFHNLNCLAYYEVALVVSALVECLEDLNAGELPASSIVVKTGVSEDYFLQIAKLRAIHRLWALLKNEYQINNNLHLIVETSLTDKSISDGYNNLLRTTVEAMAAVAGGCSELTVTAFDVLFPVNKTMSERLAINQQLILKEESYLDKMADVSCGSFYIESITDAIAAKALETFKQFEAGGGYFKCLSSGRISKDIEEQAAKKAELVATQKQIVIGVNKFKNEKEKIDLSPDDITRLKQLHLNNPVLNFELNTYFQHA